MAYKIKRKTQKSKNIFFGESFTRRFNKKKGLYEKLRFAMKEYSKETPEEKKKRIARKPKYDLSQKIGYPRYAYFYGKEHADLLKKMNSRERNNLKEINNYIRDVAVASGVVTAGASAMMFYKIPSLILSTPITTAGSIKIRRALKERRLFLQAMHKKYEGGK